MQDAVNIQGILRELQKIEKNMVTKKELLGYLETIAILSNPDAMRQIEASEADIAAGRFKAIDSVNDLL